jgi:hypothetical protein
MISVQTKKSVLLKKEKKHLENKLKEILSALGVGSNIYTQYHICTYITDLMVNEIIEKDLLKRWDIYLVWGHYKNPNIETRCKNYINDKDEYKTSVKNCENCSCEKMIEHKYIKLIEKDGEKREVILDFSRYKFKEEDYYSWKVEKTMNYESDEKHIEDLMSINDYIVFDLDNYYPDSEIYLKRKGEK